MPFAWTAYLTLAQELGARAEDEAALRSSMSRAYYAAYNMALIKLRVLQIPVDEQLAAHEKVWTAFTSHSDAACHSIGVLGDRLKKSRRKADYEEVVSNIVSETAQALVLSRIVVDRLQKLSLASA